MSQKNTKIPFVIPLTSENQQSGSDKTKADAFLASLSNQTPDPEQEIATTTQLANIKKSKLLIRTVRVESLEALYRTRGSADR